MTVSEDFTGLTGRFRVELLAHCYRMLGSAEDAEDLVQETYLRAWRSYEGFEGRSSVRTWLYRIATNACLTAIERRGRRPLPSGSAARPGPGGAGGGGARGAVAAALPDALLAGERGPGLGGGVAGGDPAGLRRGAAVPVRPAAGGADHAGRAAVACRRGSGAARHDHDRGQQRPAAGPRPARGGAARRGRAAEPAEPDQRALLDRFAAAFENADVSGLAELLREDVALEMPPLLTWFAGRPDVARFFASRPCSPRPDSSGSFRSWPTGSRRSRPTSASPRDVPRLRGDGADGHRDRIARIVTFFDPDLFGSFGLPTAIPGDPAGLQ